MLLQAPGRIETPDDPGVDPGCARELGFANRHRTVSFQAGTSPRVWTLPPPSGCNGSGGGNGSGSGSGGGSAVAVAAAVWYQ